MGVPLIGTFEETAAIVSKALGVELEKSDDGEFEPFNAYYTKTLGLTVVFLDPSRFEAKEHYELQIYSSADALEATCVDISNFLIEILDRRLNITCRKL